MPVAMENDFGMVNTAQSQLRLANLSDIDHSPHMERCAVRGFIAKGSPTGLVVPTGLEPEDVRELACRAVQFVVDREYDGAMVGGRPDVICYLQDLLVAARLCCHATDSAVALHREGYFVPLPVGWIEIVSPAGLAK